MSARKRWVIYDSRAFVDVERATVFEVCTSLKEARRRRKRDWPHSAIFAYDIGKDGELINEDGPL